MDEYAADQAIAASVPGKVISSHLAGEGPDSIGYAAIISELDGEFFVSFIEFYDPRAKAPTAQYGVPPTPEGLVVTYRESYPTALAAGERYGFFTALLTEESRLGEEGFVPGLSYLHTVVENHKGRVFAERAYEADTNELAASAYESEVERQLQQQVSNPCTRDALKSLAALKREEHSEA